MKKLVAFVLLAACELQPAPPKKEPPPAPTPPPAAAPVEGSGGSAGSAGSAVAPPPAPPAPAAADAGVADAGPLKIVVSADCIKVGAKFAQVVIDSATEPAQRSNFEQQRMNMTRKLGEVCTTQNWGEAQRNCYLATKTPQDVDACAKKFPAPPQDVKTPKQPVAPVPGAGPAGTDMKPEQPKPPAQPKPAKQ